MPNPNNQTDYSAIDEFIEDTDPRDNSLDKSATSLYNIGLGLHGASYFTGPFGPLVRGAGSLFSTAGDVVETINGRTNIPGLLGRTALNVAAAVIPGAENVRTIDKAGRIYRGINSYNRAAGKVGKSIIDEAVRIAPRKIVRYPLGVAAGAGLAYVPQAMGNKHDQGLVDAVVDEIKWDWNNPQLGGYNRGFSILSLPLYLRAAGGGAAGAAEVGRTTEEARAETAERSENTGGRTTDLDDEQPDIIIGNGGIEPEDILGSESSGEGAAGVLAPFIGIMQRTKARANNQSSRKYNSNNQSSRGYPAYTMQYNGMTGAAAKLGHMVDSSAAKNPIGTRVSNVMTDYVRNRVQKLRQLRRR